MAPFYKIKNVLLSPERSQLFESLYKDNTTLKEKGNLILSLNYEPLFKHEK